MSSSGVRSRLYDCEVVHARTSPKRNVFRYRYFTFCLDLDEIDSLSQKSLMFGKSVLRLFRFAAKDFIFSRPDKDLKSAIRDYVRERGVTQTIGRIELIAHMRTLGYAFNPAAFYFCYSHDDRPLCAILEVTNTYREKKAYFLGPETFASGSFQSSSAKHFYVSPFVDLDASFDMRFALPQERLSLQIDSKQEGRTIVHSSVAGTAAEISDLALLKRFCAHPWITFGVIAKIHFQALKLFLKNVPHLKKSDRMELRKGGLR